VGGSVGALRECRGSPLPATEGGPLGILTQEDDEGIHALSRRGWSISAISRQVTNPANRLVNQISRPRGGNFRLSDSLAGAE
jgi:hypothetical protein